MKFYENLRDSKKLGDLQPLVWEYQYDQNMFKPQALTRMTINYYYHLQHTEGSCFLCLLLDKAYCYWWKGENTNQKSDIIYEMHNY